MSYCINPKCLERQNPDHLECCQACGTQLLIKERYRLVKPLSQLDFRGNAEIFEVDDRGTPKVLKVLTKNPPLYRKVSARGCLVPGFERSPEFANKAACYAKPSYPAFCWMRSQFLDIRPTCLIKIYIFL